MLNSFVEGVGGDRVHVQSLVPIGASPETYQPTPQNVAQLSGARLLVRNGAGLETWLQRTLSNAAAPGLSVVDCSDGLTVVNKNPHLWMDPQNAKHYVAAIETALARADGEHAAEYHANALRYDAKLDALTTDIASKISRIPHERRSMIVFHNAWQYYNDRFGIETLGFIEANPGQDPNPAQLAQLVDSARSKHVRAIFGEPEYSGKLAEQIASSAGIDVLDLYDDSIGTQPQVADYVSMLRYDTGVIVKALQ